MLGLSIRRIQGTKRVAQKLIRLKGVTATLTWQGMSAENAKENLDALVELRGSLAHVSDGSTQCLTRDGASVE